MLEPVERQNMRAGEVHDVKIVAHTGAIRRVIVLPEHVEMRPAADSHLRHVRHQIVRNVVRVFPDHAAGMRTDRIEVAQDGHIGQRARPAHIVQQHFRRELGVAVRVGRPQPVRLCVGQEFRLAIDHSTRELVSWQIRSIAFGEELTKLSTITGSYPRETSSTQVCDPIYPAPPVTSTRVMSPT